jgi:hypothetical protein
VLILKDLEVYIIMGIGFRDRAERQGPSWVTGIPGLKTKKRQLGCRSPNESVTPRGMICPEKTWVGTVSVSDYALTGPSIDG